MQLAQAPSMTLDDFQSFVGVRPALLKIDVEGSEIAVLRGARRLLAQADRPAILFEYNPDTLTECGAAVDAFHELLEGYALYYIDDFEGRKKPFGSPDRPRRGRAIRMQSVRGPAGRRRSDALGRRLGPRASPARGQGIGGPHPFVAGSVFSRP